MDVLVGLGRPEAAVGDIGGETIETVDHPGEVVSREQPGLVQDAGVRLRRLDVERGQRPVEVGRLAERGHRLGRATGETTTPERTLVGRPARLRAATAAGARTHRFRSRFAAIFDDRPCSSTKPRAAD